MVIDQIQIQQMSRIEKLQTMEFLWKELSNDDELLNSPSWHNNLLNQTDTDFKNGIEEPIDWITAKQDLRRKFK